jgi:hypothetical protein
MDTNLSKIERWASVLGGGALAALALRRGPRVTPLSSALALGATALLFRGATGHCPAYQALGMNTADLEDDWSRPLSRVREGAQKFRGKWPLPEGARPARSARTGGDLVEDASAHSFPASDPPSFTPNRVG